MAAHDSDTRARLLAAATELVATAPGREVALRAVCDRVGVRLPTLYHYFGSKQGLLEAVAEAGADRYLAQKRAQGSTGDPVEDIRRGWNQHVEFGLANPGVYALMYGAVVPGRRSPARDRPAAALHTLAEAAARQGRLVVSAAEATEHVLAANVGVTLHLITASDGPPGLSTSVREATLAAVTGTRAAAEDPVARDVAGAAGQLLRALGARPPRPRQQPEEALLRTWLTRLARGTGTLAPTAEPEEAR